MSAKTFLSWSSGKDSAWALHVMRQNPQIEVAGLFCTVNKEFDRVAMHGVRTELLYQQAKAAGLPLHIIPIPYPCSNDEYAAAMTAFVAEAIKLNVECFAFGDLYLEDVRKYREDRMKGTGITPIFPIWGIPTKALARAMIDSGLKARITCLDPSRIPVKFAGREFDNQLLTEIPENVDPCGENGEFHTFAFDGPMFKHAVELTVGETVQRDGFVFTDLLPGASFP